MFAMKSINALTNFDTSLFVSGQLTYSTADIEKSIFFSAQYKSEEPSESLAKALLLVVHGDLYELINDDFPLPSKKLSDESDLFGIISIDS